MSNGAPDPTGLTIQPFRLLNLPREFLVPIIRSYRSPISKNYNGVAIYMGEEDEERHEVLRDLCLTHRDILPFAQEELFKRITIRSNERMDLLNRSIASSERCKEYAGRTESIYVEYRVDVDKLIESGAFNPRELRCRTRMMKFFILNRFQNLRRLNLYEAQFDEALTLPNLESYATLSSPSGSFNGKAAFTSVNLPNLRRLAIGRDGEVGSFGRLYDSITPKLDHLSLNWLHETDLEHLFLLSTSLQSLRCVYDRPVEGLSNVIEQISRIAVKELDFFLRIHRESSNNWETDFEPIEKFKKLVEVKDELKRVKLKFIFEYGQRPLEDVCDQAFTRWKASKDELKLICVKKGVEVVALSCYFFHGYRIIWQE